MLLAESFAKDAERQARLSTHHGNRSGSAGRGSSSDRPQDSGALGQGASGASIDFGSVDRANISHVVRSQATTPKNALRR